MRCSVKTVFGKKKKKVGDFYGFRKIEMLLKLIQIGTL